MNLKIKIVVFTLIILFADRSYSQQNNEEQQFKMPKITMPSSQAYQITKYGDLDINESSGRVTTSIALRPYKDGNLEVPIGLSYVGNGVKVNQLTTWTGINWTLEAGGAITRIVKDEPDEKVANRLLPDAALLSQLDLHNGSPTIANIIPWLDNNANNNIDTEADVFQFSFCGHSGSFFLNANMQPVLANKVSNMKIETIGSLGTTNHFRITTGDGIKYYFGASAIEETWTYGSLQIPLTAKATTTYYLYKIEHFLGNVINLEYTSLGLQMERVDIAYDPFEKIKVEHFVDNPQYPCTRYTQPQINFDNIGENMRLRVEDAKILSRIFSGSKQVLFTVRNSGNPKIKDKILESILYKEGSIIECDTKLEYIFPNGPTVADRFFLNKVIMNDLTVLDDTGHPLINRKEIYRMEYNDPEALPARFSFKQDYLGFYNGKNNPNLFPKTDNTLFSYYNNQLADREPSFQHAKKGTLKRLYYPTKGFTEFEYEAGRRPKKPLTSPKQLMVFNNSSIPNAQLTQTYTLGSLQPTLGDNGTIPPWGVFENQTITVRFSRAGEDPCVPQERDFIELRIKNLSHPNIPETSVIHNVCNLPDFQYDLNGGDVYRFILRLYTTDTDGGFADGLQTIWANFDYTYGYTEVDGLGLRAKRVIDYTEGNAAPASIKRYYYNKAINRNVLGMDSALQFFDPKFISTKLVTHCCSNAYTIGGWNFNQFLSHNNYWQIESLHANPFGGYESPATDNNVLYEYVTVSYGGDNFEAGGMEKKFDLPQYVGGHIYHAASFYNENPPLVVAGISPSLLDRHRNDEVLQGTLLAQTELMYYGGALCKKRKTAYNYSLDAPEQISNLVGEQAYIPCDIPINVDKLYDNITLVLFDTFGFHKRLIAKTTTELITPILLSADESLAHKIVDTENYSYVGVNVNPAEVTKLTSLNELQKTTFYYPEQQAAISGLTTLETTAYQKLIEQNRIDTPIQIESHLGTELLTTQRTLYDIWYGNTSACLPKTIQFSKGTAALEDRAVFHAYGNGDPTEISQKDGSKTKYIYNSNHQVIAKIENYTVQGAPTGSTNCEVYSNLYPGALVTLYDYEPNHDKLTQVTTPDCQEILYEYDSHGRLRKIKDMNGNVLEEYDVRFKN